jgi:hypothetical protein
MAPHSTEANGDAQAPVAATLNPGLSKEKVEMPRVKFVDLKPKFEDKYEEREHLKGRLAAAFRIFGKFGFGRFERKRLISGSLTRER